MQVDRVLAQHFPERVQSDTRRDGLLYALSVGLCADPVDPRQLRYVFEEDQVVRPSMALVLTDLGDPACDRHVPCRWRQWGVLRRTNGGAQSSAAASGAGCRDADLAPVGPALSVKRRHEPAARGSQAGAPSRFRTADSAWLMQLCRHHARGDQALVRLATGPAREFWGMFYFAGIARRNLDRRDLA